MQADPIVSAPFSSEGLNPYSYVFNNPLNWVDPSGFETVISPADTIHGPSAAELEARARMAQAAQHQAMEQAQAKAMAAQLSGIASGTSADESSDWSSGMANGATLAEQAYGDAMRRAQEERGLRSAMAAALEAGQGQWGPGNQPGDVAPSRGNEQDSGNGGAGPQGYPGTEGQPGAGLPPELESKRTRGFVEDIGHGFASIPIGVGTAATHLAAMSGILGPEHKQQAEEINALMSTSVKVLRNAPVEVLKEIGKEVLKYAADHPGYLVGRFGTGALISRVHPLLGLGIMPLASYGNMIELAQKGNGFVVQARGAILGIR